MSVRIDDWTLAQALADTLSPDQLHRTLDRYAKLYCPVSDVFGQSYHWRIPTHGPWQKLCFRTRRADVRSRPCLSRCATKHVTLRRGCEATH
jgi:hypothetical protein